MELHSLHPKLAARLAVAKHREDRAIPQHTLSLILQHPSARVVFDPRTYIRQDFPVSEDSIARAKAAQREGRDEFRRETGLEIDKDGVIQHPEAAHGR